MSPLTEPALLRRLDELLELPAETEWVEFKEAKHSFDSRKLGKYVSAMANEACLAGRPCGWLVFGVRNVDHAVAGTSYRSDPAKLQGLKHELARHLTGGLTVQDIYEVNHPKGRVLLFKIPPAPPGIPIAYKGHYYGRDGESLVALSIEKIERIRSMDQAKDWTAGVAEGVGLETLDPDALREARANFVAKYRGKPFARHCDQWNEATFCDKAKLTRDGQITRAALLLVGREESAHHLEPALPQITWKLEGEQRDYEHFGPPYLLRSTTCIAESAILSRKSCPLIV